MYDYRTKLRGTIAPEEKPFLDEIRADPHDDAARLIYADWLEERGDPRAEYLRLEVEYRDAKQRNLPSRRIRRRLQHISKSIDRGWLAMLAVAPIENCVHNRCPREWGVLKGTDHCGIRQCRACGNEVYFCDKIELARQLVTAGMQVAVDPALKRNGHRIDEDFATSEEIARMIAGGSEREYRRILSDIESSRSQLREQYHSAFQKSDSEVLFF